MNDDWHVKLVVMIHEELWWKVLMTCGVLFHRWWQYMKACGDNENLPDVVICSGNSRGLNRPGKLRKIELGIKIPLDDRPVQ